MDTQHSHISILIYTYVLTVKEVNIPGMPQLDSNYVTLGCC